MKNNGKIKYSTNFIQRQKISRKNLFKEFNRKVFRGLVKNIEKLCFIIPRTEGRVILYVYEYE
jgi:hypothetical protein